MNRPVAQWRLVLLRGLYLITCVSLVSTWSLLINEGATLEPMPGIAYSFWAAIGVLMALGLFKPLIMLPLILLQLFYKVTWLATIGLPLWFAGSVDAVTQELLMACGIGAILDLLIIPWRYVFHQYLRPQPVPLTRGDQVAP